MRPFGGLARNPIDDADRKNPWARMTRAEVVDRLSAVAFVHVPAPGGDTVTCRVCHIAYPCPTRVLATGHTS